jgi:hypothetical protein
MDLLIFLLLYTLTFLFIACFGTTSNYLHRNGVSRLLEQKATDHFSFAPLKISWKFL